MSKPARREKLNEWPGHDQFRVRKVRSINAWVATCKTCGWQSEPARHWLDVDTLEHTKEANPLFLLGKKNS